MRRVYVDGSPITGAPDPPPSWPNRAGPRLCWPLSAVSARTRCSVVLSKVLNPDAKTGDRELMLELMIRWCSYVPMIEA